MRPRLLGDRVDDALVFVMIERRRLARRADRRQAIRSLFHMPFDQPLQSAEIDIAILERRYQSNRHAGEHFSLGANHNSPLFG